MKGRDVYQEITGLEASRIPPSDGSPSSYGEEEEWQPLLSCLRGMPELVPPPDLREAVRAAVATVEPPRPLDCGEARDYLHLYIDGELEAAQREQVEAHRAACGACDSAFAEMERYREFCQAVPAVAPPADLRNAIYAAIRQARPAFWERLRPGWAPAPLLRWATLPVAALLLGWVLLPRFPSGPKTAPLKGPAPVATAWIPAELEPARAAAPAVPPSQLPEARPAAQLRPPLPGLRSAQRAKPPSAKASLRLAARRPSLRPEGRGKAEEPRPAVSGRNALMAFEVPWPSPLTPADQVAVVAGGPSSEGVEPAESDEPLTLNYRRMFGAITQTGRGNGIQPEDLGSSTGPSVALSASEGPKAPEATAPGAEARESSREPNRLPEGGSTASPISTAAPEPMAGGPPMATSEEGRVPPRSRPEDRG